MSIKLKPRHKWFSAPDRHCEEGWFGPHDKIEDAIFDCGASHGWRDPIFVSQGRKCTKAERIENDPDYDWEVSCKDAMEIRLPVSNHY